MAEEKTESRADLGLLEEDDEFEEFPADETNKDGEGLKESTNVWEDNWDDDKVEDDFANHLRVTHLLGIQWYMTISVL